MFMDGHSPEHWFFGCWELIWAFRWSPAAGSAQEQKRIASTQRFMEPRTVDCESQSCTTNFTNLGWLNAYIFWPSGMFTTVFNSSTGDDFATSHPPYLGMGLKGTGSKKIY